ncbi:cation:proton antiporter [Streptomyces caatingaensis]|uniref:Cation/H+ exchanger transmembrane domain-containing protein n=1 Tax=Streptomyces caatingaensis TaxID=1678637 RepID=A0A0K9XIE2_9ACTN|nr:cation:proton antiporter [Streptomyces caatingaensis]KNB53150.1 hypothetical protein AC230_06690 [Streptomyces caatingaensis]
MKDSPPEAAVLADIALVLLVGAALGPLRRRLRQPVVVAEIAAGVALGPSVLGLLPGDPTEALFPPEVRSRLAAVAQVGIVLLLFSAGRELDFRALRGRGRAVLALTAGSLAVPFALAVALTPALLAARPGTAGSTSSPLLLAPFLGVVLSVGALSVLVRIVRENRLTSSPVGVMATACGALTEVAAWCAMVALLTAARGLSTRHLFLTLALLAAYALVMAFVVRPALRACLGRRRPPGDRSAVPVLVVGSGVFLSSWCTSLIGVHAVIGAFAFGLAMPRDLGPGASRATEDPLHHTGTLLTPVFFALAGLTVDLTGLGWHGVLAVAVFLTVAWGGKFAGAALTARLLRLPRRDAATLGALVNTKGLSEIVMLSLGRDAGLVDDRLFTALLLTALLSTVLVNPVVRRLAAEAPPPPAVPDALVPGQADGHRPALRMTDEPRA